MSLPIVRLSARQRSSAPSETASLTSGGTAMADPNTSWTTFPYCSSFKRQSRGGARAADAWQGSLGPPVVVREGPPVVGEVEGGPTPPVPVPDPPGGLIPSVLPLDPVHPPLEAGPPAIDST